MRKRKYFPTNSLNGFCENLREVEPHLAGDLIDVGAVHQLGRNRHGDQLASAVVVLLLVPQLGGEGNQ